MSELRKRAKEIEGRRKNGMKFTRGKERRQR